ncbi:transcriptional regulator [Neobacillus thermocopriae]|jgi:RinA family phage transcriptional activator|uniref:transcriptional regulator n=1 Tax=Neobacillus thermocopriae TaxID=1215031 RepID=UPI002E203736|nr:transcriptional regulator [Neobacillus thermocopriae]MED3714390.1 transcriptional regulator [Neobacillus thermocopriae]
MTTTSLSKAAFKHIESELYYYHDTLKEIDRLRKEIMFGYNNEDENIGGGRSSEPGRPTERIATRLLTHKRLRNLEEMAEAILYAYESLSDDHKSVIKTKYWSQKRLTWDDVSIQLNMHRNTAMKLRKDVIYLIAEKIGWV